MGARLEILLGLFQQAHYDAALFRSWLGRHPRPEDCDSFRDQARPHWTPKARALFFLAGLLSLGIPSLFPKTLLLARELLEPIEAALTSWPASRARRKLIRARPRAVIGVTGSYGKTTTKEILGTVLAQRFRVHTTPENVNTFLGVAGWILASRFKSGDVLIVEMGAYRRGDIRQLAGMVRPAIGILTGVNEAHLERFGTIEATKAAKCELFDALPAFSGKGFWNQDSPLLREAVQERSAVWQSRGLTLIPYGANGTSGIRLAVSQHQETLLAVMAEKVIVPVSTIRAEVKLFGAHHAAAISCAIAVSDALGLRPEEIRRGLASLRPIPRRLAPSFGPRGELIIDDSYNITLDGVQSALEALGTIRRRKIGVLAGIPEAGGASGQLNRSLGRLLAPVFDLLLLRETPVAEHVAAGLGVAGWNEQNLIRYTEREEVERILARVLEPSDCLYLSAYDWPAIYL